MFVLQYGILKGNVNAMEKDRCYCLKNFIRVSEHKIPHDGQGRLRNRPKGAVAEEGDRDDELWVINNVTVAGVPYFDTYKSCLQSKARVEPHTDCLGKCSNMDFVMMQRFDLCPQETTAKFMLLYGEDGEQRKMFAFPYGETVHQW